MVYMWKYVMLWLFILENGVSNETSVINLMDEPVRKWYLGNG